MGARGSAGPNRALTQLLRPRLGLRPWLAFLRRAEAFCLLVRFDMRIMVPAWFRGSIRVAGGRRSHRRGRPGQWS